MIKLFNPPEFNINSTKYTHLLHDKIVTEFENNFAEYVGAKHAVSLDCASNGIYLALRHYHISKLGQYPVIPAIPVCLPSLMPSIVANMVKAAYCYLRFIDDVKWIGGSYTLFDMGAWKFIDSAHRVEKNQFANEANPSDLMLFSFYPTKPVGGIDGGMIVSNEKGKIDHLRLLSKNGTTDAINNWDRVPLHIGFKMYMTSAAAEVAQKSLDRLPAKKERLASIREQYNSAFGLNNTSDHLYRIEVKNNKEFIDMALQAQIQCGVHYHALHNLSLYLDHQFPKFNHDCPLSDKVSKLTVSLPFHEILSKNDVDRVIEFVKKSEKLIF